MAPIREPRVVLVGVPLHRLSRNHQLPRLALLVACLRQNFGGFQLHPFLVIFGMMYSFKSQHIPTNYWF
jgi:hypothetical protein